MLARFVDDRYVYQPPGQWLDIALGETIVSGSGDLAPAHPVGGNRAVTDPELRRVVEHILRGAEAHDAVGIRTMHLPLRNLPWRAVISEAAGALRTIGFVALRATIELPERVRRELLHRHVALFACEGEWGSATSDALALWIRGLAAASPRSHLVVLLQSPARRSTVLGASVARERLRFAGSRDAVSGQPPIGRFDLRAHRALAFARRGRRAAALRWYRAAAEAAGRRGDAAGVFRMTAHAITQHAQSGTWEKARDAAIRGLEMIHEWPLREALAGLTAHVLTMMGELERAEALLQGLLAEAAARGRRAGPNLFVRRAEVLFWQGRFEEAANSLVALEPQHADACLWRSLSHWALTGAEHAMMNPAPAPCVVWSRLDQYIEAERHLSRGETDAARGVLNSRRLVANGLPPLEKALLTRLMDQCREGANVRPTPELECFIRNSGARGILRWGLGRSAMNLLHGLSALLQVVQDADDEYSALRRG